MSESISLLSDYCINKQININTETDPFHTGLIGPEMSPITTTIGHLDAKRTSNNPVFASLITDLLTEAGLVEGDTIAIGCSGSFPGLMISSLSAAKAMGLNSRIILSLGSSSFGASNPEFTILDIYIILKEALDFDSQLLAVSLGGAKDTGGEFDRGIKEMLEYKILNNNLLLLKEEDLRQNVTSRMALYTNSDSTGIKAFINCGGSYSSMGDSPLSLKLQAGLIRTASMPPVDSYGVIFSMLDRNIPVLHLLFIKGLSQRYNLSWDPIIMPGKSIYYQETEDNTLSLLISFITLIFFIIFLISYIRLNNIK